MSKRMRSPSGEVYDGSEEEAATLQRDQDYVPDAEGPPAPTQTVHLKSRDGALYEASSPEEAATLQRDQDMVLASPEEVAARTEERRLYGKYGGAGQQALGLAEAFYRNASLGVIQGLIGDETEQRERAGVTAEESPVLYAGASAAPAIGAGVLTGGAGLGVAGTIAAEGAIGGYAGLGAATDEAFRLDQELSAEAAWGAFGKGAILGAGAAGAVIGAPRLLEATGGPRALRNRFAEAAGKAERRAEKAAFRGVGIDNPVDGLGDAVVDPAKGAKMRNKGRGAALDARKDFGETLEQLDEAEQAARRWAPKADAADGDPGVQRAAIRSELDSLRSELEPIASPAEKGVVARAFESLDRAETPDELFSAVSLSRRALADTMAGTADPATAKALQKGVARLEKLEGNARLFGAPGAASAERVQAIQDLGEARVALEQALGAGNYLETVGMRSADPVEQALDTYMARLRTVVADMPEKKNALEAIRRMEKLRGGTLRQVAGLNQIDAMSAVDPGDLRPQPPSTGTMLFDAAEQALKFGAAPVYQPYKVAKMAWKARKLMNASPEKRAKLAADLAFDAAAMADPIVGPAKLAYKYRHHIAVLAETARDEATSAAQRLVSAAKKEGAVPLAERYAKETIGEQQYTQVRKAVETLIKEPDRLAEHLAGELGNLSSEAPELVMAINEKAMAAVQFLSSKVPPSFGFSLMYPDGPPPSRQDMVSMSLYMKGVTDPSDVVDAIGNGTAMPEEVEAFRAVHATWFSELQQATHTEVQMANQEGRTVPAMRIAQLETLLDMPGHLDPTFSDQVASVVRGQLLAQKEAQAAPSYVPPPKAGQRAAPSGVRA
jgi:hypothetical protein